MSPMTRILPMALALLSRRGFELVTRAGPGQTEMTIFPIVRPLSMSS